MQILEVIIISSSSCSTLNYQWLGSFCFYPFHGRIIWHLLSLSKEQQLPSIATNTAVCPLVSWSVIASFTSFAMCKPLRRIHSRFPISTEYTWEADGPTWREKRKTRNLQKLDMPETLCLRTTVSGCTCYWNTLQRFSFVWVFDWEWPHPRHFIWGLIERNEAYLKGCCRGQTQTHRHYLLTAHKTFLLQDSLLSLFIHRTASWT